MPYVVVCPNCSAKLKSNAVVPAGRRITCPACKTIIVTEHDSPSEEELAAQTKPAPAPKPRKPVEEDVFEPEMVDDDEIMEPELIDDDEPAPKKKKKPSEAASQFNFGSKSDDDRPSKKRSRDEDEDDEDDRPRRKKSSRAAADEDDEDDRPRKKKGRAAYDDDDDFEDDDRPRGKKGRAAYDDDDDFEDDDRPRGKSKNKSKTRKKGGLNPLVLIGGAVGGVLLLGGMAFLAYYLFFSGGGPGSEITRWMPLETESVNYTNLKKIRGIDAIKNKEKFEDLPPGLGVKEEDIDEVYEVGCRNSVGKLVILKGSSNLSGEACKKDKATEIKHNDLTYFRLNAGGGYAYFPKTGFGVVASNEGTLKQLMDKGSEVTIPEDLKEAFDEISGCDSYQIAVGHYAKVLSPMKGTRNTTFNIMAIEFSSSSAKLKFITNFTTTEEASAAVKEGEENMEKEKKGLGAGEPDKQKREMAESASISRSGTTVTFSVSIPYDSPALGIFR
ncbi:MAG: hypothetical protein R3B84_12835 [Zavarzinella sp.]